MLVRQRQEVQALPRGVSAPANLARILDWDGCLNARDLGGLRTVDGRVVRWAALVRSDLPCRLTDIGRAAPVTHGIRTIIDLRFPDEVATDWDRYPFADWLIDAAPDGPRYLNVPFGEVPTAQLPAAREAFAAAASRGEINILDVDHNRFGMASVVGAIADAQPGGVLIHCHGGKDRTGMVVAILLAYLGVSDDDIAEDYALSMLNLEPLIIEWLDSTSQDPAERDRLRALATPTREAMLDTIDHLRSRHGSAEAYLRGGGVSDQQLAHLRARLLE
jgi:protein tyrosine/serine phosphatase